MKGDHAKAVDLARKAVEIEAKLVSEHPEIPEYRKSLAFAYSAAGLALQEMGDYPGAVASLRKTVEVGSTLIADYPNVPLYGHVEAVGYNNLGGALGAMRDFAGAAEAFKKGIAIRSKEVAEHPEVPDYWRGLANKSNNLATALQMMGDTRGAVAALRESARSWARLASDHPDVPDYQRGLALAYSNLSYVVLTTSDEIQEAADCSRRSVEILTKPVSAHPESVDLRYTLGACFLSVALACQAQGRPEDAIAAFRKAIDEQRIALTQAPGAAKIRQALTGDCRILAALLRARGREDEAAETMRQCPNPSLLDQTTAYDLACALALHARFSQDAAPRRSLADSAIDALRAAIDAGFSDAVHASRDPDLQVLRDRVDFRRLLAEMWDRPFPVDPFAK
jgi:tetratricopeptide (TPR) repeat protein